METGYLALKGALDVVDGAPAVLDASGADAYKNAYLGPKVMTPTTFVGATCTPTMDTACHALTPPCGHPLLYYEETAPGEANDRACLAKTICSATEYETDPGTATTNRQCAQLLPCLPNTYENIMVGPKEPAACIDPLGISTCTLAGATCSPSKCVYAPLGGPTSFDIKMRQMFGIKMYNAPRVCRPLTMCKATEYQSVAPTATTDRQCAPITECKQKNEFESKYPAKEMLELDGSAVKTTLFVTNRECRRFADSCDPADADGTGGLTYWNEQTVECTLDPVAIPTKPGQRWAEIGPGSLTWSFVSGQKTLSAEDNWWPADNVELLVTYPLGDENYGCLDSPADFADADGRNCAYYATVDPSLEGSGACATTRIGPLDVDKLSVQDDKYSRGATTPLSACCACGGGKAQAAAVSASSPCPGGPGCFDVSPVAFRSYDKHVGLCQAVQDGDDALCAAVTARTGADAATACAAVVTPEGAKVCTYMPYPTSAYKNYLKFGRTCVEKSVAQGKTVSGLVDQIACLKAGQDGLCVAVDVDDQGLCDDVTSLETAAACEAVDGCRYTQDELHGRDGTTTRKQTCEAVTSTIQANNGGAACSYVPADPPAHQTLVVTTFAKPTNLDSWSGYPRTVPEWDTAAQQRAFVSGWDECIPCTEGSMLQDDGTCEGGQVSNQLRHGLVGCSRPNDYGISPAGAGGVPGFHDPYNLVLGIYSHADYEFFMQRVDTCSFRVYVYDDEPPVLTCPPDLDVCTDGGTESTKNFATVDTSATPAVTPSWRFDQAQAEGCETKACLSGAVTEETLQQMFHPTVEDNVATPDELSASPSTVDYYKTTAVAHIAWRKDAADWQPGYAGVYNQANQEATPSGSTHAFARAIGKHTVTWTAADTYGNVGSCSSTIQVHDCACPRFTKPGGYTLPDYTLPGKCYGRITSLWERAGAQVTDNSGVPATVTLTASGTSDGVTRSGLIVDDDFMFSVDEDTTVIATAVDGSSSTVGGQTTEPPSKNLACTVTIEVQITDNEAPTFETCTGSTIVYDGLPKASVEVSMPRLSLVDNCCLDCPDTEGARIVFTDKTDKVIYKTYPDGTIDPEWSAEQGDPHKFPVGEDTVVKATGTDCHGKVTASPCEFTVRVPGHWKRELSFDAERVPSCECPGGKCPAARRRLGESATWQLPESNMCPALVSQASVDNVPDSKRVSGDGSIDDASLGFAAEYEIKPTADGTEFSDNLGTYDGDSEDFDCDDTGIYAPSRSVEYCAVRPGTPEQEKVALTKCTLVPTTYDIRTTRTTRTTAISGLLVGQWYEIEKVCNDCALDNFKAYGAANNDKETKFKATGKRPTGADGQAVAIAGCVAKSQQYAAQCEALTLMEPACRSAAACHWAPVGLGYCDAQAGSGSCEYVGRLHGYRSELLPYASERSQAYRVNDPDGSWSVALETVALPEVDLNVPLLFSFRYGGTDGDLGVAYSIVRKHGTTPKTIAFPSCCRIASSAFPAPGGGCADACATAIGVVPQQVDPVKGQGNPGECIEKSGIGKPNQGAADALACADVRLKTETALTSATECEAVLSDAALGNPAGTKACTYVPYAKGRLGASRAYPDEYATSAAWNTYENNLQAFAGVLSSRGLATNPVFKKYGQGRTITSVKATVSFTSNKPSALAYFDDFRFGTQGCTTPWAKNFDTNAIKPATASCGGSPNWRGTEAECLETRGTCKDVNGVTLTKASSAISDEAPDTRAAECTREKNAAAHTFTLKTGVESCPEYETWKHPGATWSAAPNDVGNDRLAWADNAGGPGINGPCDDYCYTYDDGTEKYTGEPYWDRAKCEAAGKQWRAAWLHVPEKCESAGDNCDGGPCEVCEEQSQSESGCKSQVNNDDPPVRLCKFTGGLAASDYPVHQQPFYEAFHLPDHSLNRCAVHLADDVANPPPIEAFTTAALEAKAATTCSLVMPGPQADCTPATCTAKQAVQETCIGRATATAKAALACAAIVDSEGCKNNANCEYTQAAICDGIGDTSCVNKCESMNDQRFACEGERARPTDGKTVAINDLLVGQWYRIETECTDCTTHNFNAYGAAVNDAGTEFKATGKRPTFADGEAVAVGDFACDYTAPAGPDHCKCQDKNSIKPCCIKTTDDAGATGECFLVEARASAIEECDTPLCCGDSLATNFAGVLSSGDAVCPPERHHGSMCSFLQGSLSLVQLNQAVEQLTVDVDSISQAVDEVYEVIEERQKLATFTAGGAAACPPGQEPKPDSACVGADGGDQTACNANGGSWTLLGRWWQTDPCSACPPGKDSPDLGPAPCAAAAVRDCDGSWSEFTACSASCGSGTQTRAYTVHTPLLLGGAECPEQDGTTQTQPCQSGVVCVVNCVGHWELPTSCSKSCGGGVNTTTYKIDTYADGGGQDCAVDEADRVITQSCNPQACPPVDCVGSWGFWGACNPSCGTGTRERTYAVTQEEQGGGAVCAVATGAQEQEPCNDGECPVVRDCEGAWGAWGQCSRQCAGGTKMRAYQITAQPQNGGTACPLDEEVACNQQPCVVDCEGSWGPYGPCASYEGTTCGSGIKSRTYTVAIPASTDAGYEGAPCPAVQDDVGELPCTGSAPAPCPEIFRELTLSRTVPDADEMDGFESSFKKAITWIENAILLSGEPRATHWATHHDPTQTPHIITTPCPQTHAKFPSNGIAVPCIHLCRQQKLTHMALRQTLMAVSRGCTD
jgi:hypothetical protein